MTIKLLIKQHLEFLSLKGGCRGSSESVPVKIPQCWKSRRGSIMLKLVGKKVKKLFTISYALKFVTHTFILHFFLYTGKEQGEEIRARSQRRRKDQKEVDNHRNTSK